MGWVRLRCDLEEGTSQAGGEREETEAVQDGQGEEQGWGEAGDGGTGWAGCYRQM